MSVSIDRIIAGQIWGNVCIIKEIQKKDLQKILAAPDHFRVWYLFFCKCKSDAASADFQTHILGRFGALTDFAIKKTHFSPSVIC